MKKLKESIREMEDELFWLFGTDFLEYYAEISNPARYNAYMSLLDRALNEST